MGASAALACRSPVRPTYPLTYGHARRRAAGRISRATVPEPRHRAKGGPRWLVRRVARPFGYDVHPTTRYLTPAPPSAARAGPLRPLRPRQRRRPGAGRVAERGPGTAPRPAGPGATRPSSPCRATRSTWARSSSARTSTTVPTSISATTSSSAASRLRVPSGARTTRNAPRRPGRSSWPVSSFVPRCGKHFVGTSAVDNRYRYRYYTCFTRQRYGTKYCAAGRLPGEELGAAVLDALFHVYERTDLFDEAAAAARRRARAERGNHDQELTVVGAAITKAEDAIERYLSGFEVGSGGSLVVAMQQASATRTGRRGDRRDATPHREGRHQRRRAGAQGTPPSTRSRDPRRRSRPRCIVVLRARRREPEGSRPGAIGFGRRRGVHVRV